MMLVLDRRCNLVYGMIKRVFMNSGEADKENYRETHTKEVTGTFTVNIMIETKGIF